MTPSRTLVISIALVALASLVLGLTTDIGLFGWSLAALLALCLATAVRGTQTRSRIRKAAICSTIAFTRPTRRKERRIGVRAAGS